MHCKTKRKFRFFLQYFKQVNRSEFPFYLFISNFRGKQFPILTERVKPVVRREYIEDEEKVERHDRKDIGDMSEDSEAADKVEAGAQGEHLEVTPDAEDDSAEELFVHEESDDDSDQDVLPTSATIASSQNSDKFQVRLFLN